MVMTPFSVCGNCVTGSWKMARRPRTRMSRLMTAERTGRRTKRSVSFTRASSVLLGSRVGLVERQHAVVNDELRSILDLHLAAADDDIAGIEPLDDRHLVASRRAESHEDQLGRCIPAGSWGVVHQIDRLTVRVVRDCS